MKKYHYEYEIRCCNMCWGGVKYGPFKTIADAKSEISRQQITKGPHWIIKKFRVYDSN